MSCNITIVTTAHFVNNKQDIFGPDMVTIYKNLLPIKIWHIVVLDNKIFLFIVCYMTKIEYKTNSHYNNSCTRTNYIDDTNSNQPI